MRKPILLATLILTQAALADVQVSNIDDQGNESIVKIGKQWGKVIDKSDPNHYMMIDMKKNEFYIVDNTEKIVVILGNMADMMPDSPHGDMPQQKPEIQIKNTGSGPEVAGFKTQVYKLTANGQLCSEHYISKEPLKYPEIKAFSDSMRTQAKSGFGMNEFDQSPCEKAESYFDEKVFEHGIPLLSKDAEGNEMFKITEIKTNVSFSKDELQLPKDYPVLTQAELMQREMERNRDSSMGNPMFNAPDFGSDGMPSPEEMQELQKQLEQMQQMMQKNGEP